MFIGKLSSCLFLSQIIAECSELQQELHSFRTERDELYQETLTQQALLEALEGDKRRLEQDLDWLAKRGCGSHGCGLGSPSNRRRSNSGEKSKVCQMKLIIVSPQERPTLTAHPIL